MGWNAWCCAYSKFHNLFFALCWIGYTKYQEFTYRVQSHCLLAMKFNFLSILFFIFLFFLNYFRYDGRSKYWTVFLIMDFQIINFISMTLYYVIRFAIHCYPEGNIPFIVTLWAISHSLLSCGWFPNLMVTLGKWNHLLSAWFQYEMWHVWLPVWPSLQLFFICFRNGGSEITKTTYMGSFVISEEE